MRKKPSCRYCPSAPRLSDRHSRRGPPAVTGRRVRSTPSQLRCRSASMRGIRQAPGLATAGMPLLARWRDNGIWKMRVTLPSMGRLPRPADNCHSNKYPLRVSAIDENARSLRADYRRVNRRKFSAWGIRIFFRTGSGSDFQPSPKPAPTMEEWTTMATAHRPGPAPRASSNHRPAHRPAPSPGSPRGSPGAPS